MIGCCALSCSFILANVFMEYWKHNLTNVRFESQNVSLVTTNSIMKHRDILVNFILSCVAQQTAQNKVEMVSRTVQILLVTKILAATKTFHLEKTCHLAKHDQLKILKILISISTGHYRCCIVDATRTLPLLILENARLDYTLTTLPKQTL